MKSKNKARTNKSYAGANNNKNNQMNKGSMNINTNNSAEFANENPYSVYSSNAKATGSVSKAQPNSDAVSIRGSRSNAYSTEFSNEMANNIKSPKTETVNMQKTTGMADMVGTMGTINAGKNQMEAAEDSGLIDTMKKTSKKAINKAEDMMGMNKKSKNNYSAEFSTESTPTSNLTSGATASRSSKINKRKNEFQKNLKQNYNIEIGSDD